MAGRIPFYNQLIYSRYEVRSWTEYDFQFHVRRSPIKSGKTCSALSSRFLVMLYRWKNKEPHDKRAQHNACEDDQQQCCKWHINTVLTSAKPGNIVINVQPHEYGDDKQVEADNKNPEEGFLPFPALAVFLDL